MKRWQWIALGVLAVIVIAAGMTVLNRRWLVRRINKRWLIYGMGAPDPEMPGALAPAEIIRYTELQAREKTLAQLWALYQHGEPTGWDRKA